MSSAEYITFSTGWISPMNGVYPDDLCIKELVNRLGDGEVKELIMATNPTAEGDVTALFISRLVKPLEESIAPCLRNPRRRGS